jgi:branched-chain amino acid aminotransferase
VDIKDRIVYAEGGFRRYDDARVGLLTHGLNYGTGCFEGIRGFWNAEEGELYLLQVRDHYDRLAQSASILLMRVPQTTEALVEITIELCRRNGYEENVYVRPLIYKAGEDVGVRLHNVREAFGIVAIPYTGYFGADAGLKVCVSSWRRADDTIAPARAKITGNYVNSALAKSEAQMNGFDEAILLSHDGHVSEGSAENMFMVRGGALHTPDVAQNILEGVTRRSMIEIARREIGIDVVERAIDRSELYCADELFFTGTAVGVTYVSSVDHRLIGNGTAGPVVRRLREIYARAALGQEPAYRDWVTPVYRKQREPAAVGDPMRLGESYLGVP